MKLMKIGVNWSAEVDENWWKLMKVDENWKSCENWINKRSRKIEWNSMKFEKLDEIAKIGQIELNCGKLRNIAFLLAGEVHTTFFSKKRIQNWVKLVQIEWNWRKLAEIETCNFCNLYQFSSIFAICINFRQLFRRFNWPLFT